MHEAGPVLSVRGHARRSTPPDYGLLAGFLQIFAGSKQEALAEAGRLQRAVTQVFEALGGTPTQATRQQPLTWLTRNVVTHREENYDHQAQRPEPTGRIIARVNVEATIRDFALLAPLGDALAAIEEFSTYAVIWHVDDDNPAWPLVRADAIGAAIRQAQDYAAALKCEILRVEHVADVGLLGEGGPSVAAAPAGGRAFLASVTAPGSGPVLDSQPQELTATIEARFSTTQAAVNPSSSMASG